MFENYSKKYHLSYLLLLRGNTIMITYVFVLYFPEKI